MHIMTRHRLPSRAKWGGGDHFMGESSIKLEEYIGKYDSECSVERPDQRPSDL